MFFAGWHSRAEGACSQLVSRWSRSSGEAVTVSFVWHVSTMSSVGGERQGGVKARLETI